MRTVGIKNAIIYAAGGQFVAFLVNLISSGEFDRVEFAQVVGIALTALLGAVSPADEVVPK